jgi:hypothetical protein
VWQKDEVASVCVMQVQATSSFTAFVVFLSPLNQGERRDNKQGAPFREYKLMKKTFILFFVFCFLACLCSGGCKGKKQEGSKPSTSLAKKGEKKTVTPPATNYAPKIVEAKVVPDPAYANTDLKVEVKAEDPEGDLINFKYQWIIFKDGGPVRKEVIFEGETNPTLSHDKFVHGDILAVRITPFDWKGAEGQMYQSQLVVIKNSPPEIISSPPDDIAGGLFTYPVKVKDPDNDPITFSLSKDAPKGMTIDPASGLITWAISPGTIGTFAFKVNGDDGHGGTCYQKITLTLLVQAGSPQPK